MPRNSLPIAGGSQIETFKLPSGLHVPSSLMRGMGPAGEPIDVLVTAEGHVQTAPAAGSLRTDSARDPGSIKTVGVASSTILASFVQRRFLFFYNRGPGIVTLRMADAGNAVNYEGIVIPPEAAWEMPENARIGTAVRAIATAANTQLSTVEW